MEQDRVPRLGYGESPSHVQFNALGTPTSQGDSTEAVRQRAPVGGAPAQGGPADLRNVSKLPSGRWRARYPDPDHRGPGRPAWINAPTTFLTKGDANGWLAAREAELVEHRWRPIRRCAAPVETFAEYAERWLATRELKPSTIREYSRTMRSLVATFGKLPLDEIASVDIRTWYSKLDPNLKTARAHKYALTPHGAEHRRRGGTH